jgi:hypothetical protein
MTRVPGARKNFAVFSKKAAGNPETMMGRRRKGRWRYGFMHPEISS